ncbi:MAG: cytochrome c maturation protein CcmE [Gammaproteobacteria bacterium]
MTRRGRRLLGVGALAISVGLAAALTLTAFRKNLMSFYTPTDLVAAPVPEGARLRLGGLVETGSLKRAAEGMRVDFVVADCVNKVAVRYDGLLPDLFREGQGIVATGSLNAEKVFVADEVLAKHDENYMPPQVAAGLQTPQGHSCAPFKSVMQPNRPS